MRHHLCHKAASLMRISGGWKFLPQESVGQLPLHHGVHSRTNPNTFESQPLRLKYNTAFSSRTLDHYTAIPAQAKDFFGSLSVPSLHCASVLTPRRFSEEIL